MPEEDVAHIILQDMSVLTFLVFFGIAVLGAISSFAFSVVKAVRRTKFEWPMFWTGAIRSIISTIVLALAIIEWGKVSSMIFESEGPVELTVWSAFLLGTLTERLSQIIFGTSKQITKDIQKKEIV